MAIALYATGPNGAFGLNGKLPFKCKRDMERFAAITKLHGSLAMGKATFDSVGPLKDRLILIVTSDKSLLGKSVMFAIGDPRYDGVCAAKYVTLEYALRNTDIFVGGAKLLTSVWPAIHKVYKSTIFDTSIGGMEHDVRFAPDLDPFTQVYAERHGDHYFEVLVRK